MTNSDTAIREFAEKVMREHGRWWSIEAKDTDKFIADLTALISEHYVAKEEVDKMVSERLREELIRYIKWYGGFNYENMTDEMLVNEYLKTRDSHESV